MKVNHRSVPLVLSAALLAVLGTGCAEPVPTPVAIDLQFDPARELSPQV